MAGGYGSLEPARLVDTPHRGSPDASVATELADPPALLRQSQHLRHGHPRLLLHPCPPIFAMPATRPYALTSPRSS